MIAGSGSGDADRLFRLGTSLLEADKPAEAARCLSQAAEKSPDSPPILEKLAEACHRSGQLLPALRAYDRLIELGAATAKTWLATGNALTDVAEYAQAIGAYERSIALDAGNPEAHHNLARSLYRLGDLDRGAGHLDTAISQSDSMNSWLSLATMIPGSPAATHDRILDVRRSYGSKLAADAPNQPEQRISHAKTRSPRLRVGYVSAFFHSANYMKPVWGLVNHHDRQSFDVHLFSDTLASKMPGYVRHDRDTVHETGSLSNGDLAGLVRDCQIDILVDLNAYSVPERLPLLARKAAPVVLAWFNMYATSGLAGIDAVIGDREVVRPCEEPFYSEKVLHLPLSYLTFEVLHPCPPVAPPPCLKNGYLTFGSLVSQYKIAAPVLDAWAEILRRTDGSRLLLANSALKSPHNRAYVLERFAERGVDAERLQLLGPAEHYAFLTYYDSIDVALDAFPYNGGTTTMEALWQGVPVLTFDGDRWASRTSPSILRNTHLGEFVAQDVQTFVAQGVSLATDPSAPARLAALRKQMRKRLRQSQACDTRLLAKSMERLYQETWHGR